MLLNEKKACFCILFCFLTKIKRLCFLKFAASYKKWVYEVFRLPTSAYHSIIQGSCVELIRIWSQRLLDMLTSSPSHTIKKIRRHGEDFSEKEIIKENFFFKNLCRNTSYTHFYKKQRILRSKAFLFSLRSKIRSKKGFFLVKKHFAS